MTHPNEALFPGEKTFPFIASCEHFAGNEKMIGKARSIGQGRLQDAMDRMKPYIKSPEDDPSIIPP